MNKRFQAILLGVVVALAMGGSGAYANCLDFGGFAIFQCADLGFFAPPPVPVQFDPNGKPLNIAATFWQVGFGNHEPGKCLNTTTRLACTTATGCSCASGLLGKVCNVSSLPDPDTFCSGENGIGSAGTGNSGLNDFNGNDAGLFAPDLKDAQIATANPAVPFGATCLSSNNWGNTNVDGCADNTLLATQLQSKDGILNPYYDVHYARDYAAPGYYSLYWQQDHPMAALLTTIPDARYFAIAGVATLNRGNLGDGTNGPCNMAAPGLNDAVCDPRPGFYAFKDVNNGQANPATGGTTFNVIPWQQVPRPRAACTAGCSGTGARTINFNWDPVRWYDDSSHRPSQNLAVGPADATRQNGVGFGDFKVGTSGTNAGNFAGMVRYNLQMAPVGAANLDPNGRLLFNTLAFADVTGQTEIGQPGLNAAGDPSGLVTRTGLSVAPDTCWRVQVRFGKKSEATTTWPGAANQSGTAICRLGKCGDRGYNAASLDPAVITCVGGSLVSEKAVDVTAVKKLGTVTLSWRMTAELALQGFNVYTVNGKGTQTKIGSVPCQACNTGESKDYSFVAPMTQIKGAKTIVLEVLSANGNSKTPINF